MVLKGFLYGICGPVRSPFAPLLLSYHTSSACLDAKGTLGFHPCIGPEIPERSVSPKWLQPMTNVAVRKTSSCTGGGLTLMCA